MNEHGIVSKVSNWSKNQGKSYYNFEKFLTFKPEVTQEAIDTHLVEYHSNQQETPQTFKNHSYPYIL